MPRRYSSKKGKSPARSHRKSKAEKGFFHEISSDSGMEDKMTGEDRMMDEDRY